MSSISADYNLKNHLKSKTLSSNILLGSASKSSKSNLLSAYDASHAPTLSISCMKSLKMLES